MSYKALELQIALPRTFEAGKMLTDMQQRGVVSQGQLKDEQESIEEKKRTQTEKTNRKKNGYFERSGNHQGTLDSNQLFFKHPYKGKQIDYVR